jgi:hypothetical protein
MFSGVDFRVFFGVFLSFYDCQKEKEDLFFTSPLTIQRVVRKSNRGISI